MSNRFIYSFAIAFLFFTASCTNDQRVDKEASETPNIIHQPDTPEHVRKLENVSIFSLDSFIPDTVELVEEVIFESNEDVFLVGYISRVAVDSNDRVYIVSSIPGALNVYVFEPDGTYITKFGNPGRGPGDFESITSIDVERDIIYTFDTILQRFATFSTNDYSLLSHESLNSQVVFDNDDLMLRGRQFMVRNDGSIIMRFDGSIPSKLVTQGKYFNISADGNIDPNYLHKLRDHKVYLTFDSVKRTSNGNTVYPFAMPFDPHELIAISDHGPIYTAWTEDFLIKVHDKYGNYERSFFYPYKKSDVVLREMNLGHVQKEELTNHEIPDKWPALYNMVTDDKKRLWVATVTESKDTLKWWVLNEQGKIIADFVWKGERKNGIEVPHKIRPLMLINNGYLYTIDINIKEGHNRVIKHKINFKPRRSETSASN